MQRPLSLLALLLTASVAHAQTPGRVPPDNRMIIPVTKSERNHVLSDMRDFLHGLHIIQFSLARQDMKSVVLMARSMGPVLEHVPRSLKDKLPEEFTQLAIAQNEAFQALAKMAENKTELSAMLEQTAEIITYCSGCHDSYRFELTAPTKSR